MVSSSERGEDGDYAGMFLAGSEWVCGLQNPLNHCSDDTSPPACCGGLEGRAQDVENLSADLHAVENDLHRAEKDHLEIKATTKDLRRRVDRMKERRRYMQEEGNARRERERLEKEREVFEKIRAEEEERQAEVGCRRGGTDSERDDGQGDSAGHTSGEDPTLIVYDTEKGN
eukprot:CAMPEP_0172536254 /NCGR_PEP_ID=MMETSP1067-20121228/8045_1 /TAXON_ID=265564 ORGANISM="Thalassiosira punctigera, Strain Tpunct2005C2" /NCGR_SAMPLE_ID=MMETSP1067 /ASSEMBLY_ACC=CAM_ASM_000444 /LENGTH=171 /DNA_ID=CAMNT_0013321289 /DNA_START=68 /DNA_END=583 /DNA_ORIENTATION=-